VGIKSVWAAEDVIYRYEYHTVLSLRIVLHNNINIISRAGRSLTRFVIRGDQTQCSIIIIIIADTNTASTGFGFTNVTSTRTMTIIIIIIIFANRPQSSKTCVVFGVARGVVAGYYNYYYITFVRCFPPRGNRSRIIDRFKCNNNIIMTFRRQ